MNELYEYLKSVNYQVSLDNNVVTIKNVTTTEILTLVKGINFKELQIEAVVKESLTYDIRQVK